MPIKFKRAYLEEIRFRYRNSKKKAKGIILDEFCGVCDLTRKHAIKILKGSFNPRTHRPGPKSKYQCEDVLKALKELWQLMNQMCSKKMVVAFYDWLPFYEAKDEVKILLLQMSASTVDRWRHHDAQAPPPSPTSYIVQSGSNPLKTVIL